MMTTISQQASSRRQDRDDRSECHGRAAFLPHESDDDYPMLCLMGGDLELSVMELALDSLLAN